MLLRLLMLLLLLLLLPKQVLLNVPRSTNHLMLLKRRRWRMGTLVRQPAVVHIGIVRVHVHLPRWIRRWARFAAIRLAMVSVRVMELLVRWKRWGHVHVRRHRGSIAHVIPRQNCVAPPGLLLT